MALLDKFTGDNDYRREARSKKAANEALARESDANARLAEAQERAIQKQADAAAKAQERAADAEFASTMAKLTFSGEPKEIVQDFETVYQYWLKKDLKKDQKKIVADKLELGLMALKKADSMKGDFYEKKVKEEKKKQKIMKIVKIVGYTVGIIALLLLMIGLSNQ